MKRREIVCVQPHCGRRTRDFYQVDVQTALRSPGVQSGPTCAPCWEDIVRRQIRDQSRQLGVVPRGG